MHSDPPHFDPPRRSAIDCSAALRPAALRSAAHSELPKADTPQTDPPKAELPHSEPSQLSQTAHFDTPIELLHSGTAALRTAKVIIAARQTTAVRSAPWSGPPNFEPPKT